MADAGDATATADAPAVAPPADLLALPLTAVLATVDADGSAHAVPVWFRYDGQAHLATGAVVLGGQEGRR